MIGVNFVTLCHIFTMSRSPYRESLLNCLSCLRDKRRLHRQVVFWKLLKQCLPRHICKFVGFSSKRNAMTSQQGHVHNPLRVVHNPLEKITSGIFAAPQIYSHIACGDNYLRILRYQSSRVLCWCLSRRLWTNQMGSMGTWFQISFRGTDRDTKIVVHREGNRPEYGCNTSPPFGALLRGNGKLLFLGRNSVHFWLCYNRWNDGILFYQDLEEGVWRGYNSANQKTKNDFLEI